MLNNVLKNLSVTYQKLKGNPKSPVKTKSPTLLFLKKNCGMLDTVNIPQCSMALQK